MTTYFFLWFGGNPFWNKPICGVHQGFKLRWAAKGRQPRSRRWPHPDVVNFRKIFAGKVWRLTNTGFSMGCSMVFPVCVSFLNQFVESKSDRCLSFFYHLLGTRQQQNCHPSPITCWMGVATLSTNRSGKRCWPLSSLGQQPCTKRLWHAFSMIQKTKMFWQRSKKLARLWTKPKQRGASTPPAIPMLLDTILAGERVWDCR